MCSSDLLIIRGRFEGALRAQTLYACLDALDGILEAAGRTKGLAHSGPRWPAHLILGEGKQSSVGNGEDGSEKATSKPRKPHR